VAQLLCFLRSALIITFASLVPLAASALDYNFQWALPTPQGNSLQGMDFEGTQIGYAVGTKGASTRTTDGGVTWQVRSSFDSFDKDLTDVVVIAPGTLLAVGAPPGIFRSNDGGNTWNAVANPSTQILQDIEIAAGSTIFAIGEQGQVVRSTDGGTSWSLRTSPGANSLHEQHWFSATDGIVVGSFIARRTTDGGATWNPLPGVMDTQDSFNEVFQAAPGVLFAFADFHYAKTTNGGTSWDWIFNPVFPVYRGKAVAFDVNHLMLVTNLEGAEVWESTDGGNDWDPIYQRFDLGGFLEFRRLADGSLFVCSTEGDVIKSTNNGALWINSTHSPDDEERVIIADIEVLPGGHAFAGSMHSSGVSRWHQSNDGGLTWFEAAASPGIINVNDVEFWDDDHGLACGSVNNVWRTTDGGGSWASSTLPNVIPNGVSGIQFALPAAGVGFCAADGFSGALVFRTTNFGATWEQRSTGIPQGTSVLSSVSFLDASTGFAAGGNQDQSRIWKTTDGGGSWAQINTTGVPNFLSGTHWFDSSTGLASIQAASPGIYRTTNGGGNWTQVFNQAVMRISFAGQVGYGKPGAFTYGHIFSSENAGATWNVVDLPCDRGGSSVTALTDGFLAGGAASQIVRATIETATDAPGVIAAPHRESSLGWIRAMPSIGREIGIEWGLHASAHHSEPFSIELIDVTGRRVSRIASGVLFPGDGRSARWDGQTEDGAKAATGVYFARLMTGEGAQAVRVQFTR
jgi:photosystem II stability/assembly factor-like uncharacterized protein